MFAVSSYRCPYCRKEFVLPQPVLYDSQDDARGVCTVTQRWPYAPPRPEGVDVVIYLQDGSKMLHMQRHQCPALSI